jgi:L-ascorbate metabolism protein UlaG (beta-lactamase superfamily)
VAASEGTALTWLGHAAWLLRSPTGTTILIDPWLDNPRKPVDVALPESVDAIVVTHGHADHVGEAVALAEKMHAPVVGSFELIEALGLKDGIGANPGGTVTIKDIELHLTQAIHSSSVAMPHPPLPPPPAGALQGAKDSCDCPDHKVCVEQHHHDHFVHKAPGSDGDHKDHDHKNKPAGHKGHEGHRHKHKGKHAEDGHEAQELVLAEAPAKMGPMEGAVAQGTKLAQKAENASPASGPCHCDVPEATGPHHKPHFAYAGAPMGVILKVAHGPTIYHAGDTDVFLDMGLIKRRYEPEVALLPIGGHYTMGPKDAALAASMLGVHDVVPMHYGTSPLLNGTPQELKEALEDEQRMIAPRPGATIRYPERR